MGQLEYNNFKQRIKEWMDTHLEEYDCFEEEINKKDTTTYQVIMNKAISFVPQYQKIIKKKVNQGQFDDISDIENLFTENKLAESLINEFENPNKESIIPALLAWIYYGKSFERMVEKGEELRKSNEINYFQKIFIAYGIKMLISKSISLGLRSKSDWQEHNRLMKMVDSDKVMDWAIENNIPEEKKKAGRKIKEKTLPEMFLETGTQKPNDLINKIGRHLIHRNAKQDLAYLKIALEDLLYIYPCEVKLFRDAISLQYGDKIHIIGERGIQDAYKELTSYMSSQGILVKDLPENRDIIDELKNFLSN